MVTEKKQSNTSVKATMSLLQQSLSQRVQQAVSLSTASAPVPATGLLAFAGIRPPAPPLAVRGRPRAPTGNRGNPRPPAQARPPAPRPVAKAAPQKSLAEQLAEQASRLRAPSGLNRAKSTPQTTVTKSLAEQLQDQLKIMEERKLAKLETQKMAKSQVNVVENKQEDAKTDEGNKAWDLSRKLQARMSALQGVGSKSRVLQTRKQNFKKTQNLADSDDTPSDFDPEDSDNDQDSSSSDSGSD